MYLKIFCHWDCVDFPLFMRYDLFDPKSIKNKSGNFWNTNNFVSKDLEINLEGLITL